VVAWRRSRGEPDARAARVATGARSPARHHMGLYQLDVEGMTLVEVLVALLVLTIVLVPAFTVLTHGMDATNTTRLRVEATSLATTALEQVQHEAEFSPPVGGTTTVSQSIGQETFTVSTTFTPIAEAGGSFETICQSGSSATDLQIWLVSAAVSWNKMAGAAPVIQTTEVAPGTTGAANLADGEIAVSVDGLDGQPLRTAPINYTITPVRVAGSASLPPTITGNTGMTGCGVALAVNPNPDFQWSVTLTPNPGYVSTTEQSDVNPAGPPSIAAPLTVDAGQVTQLQQPFQVAEGVTVTPTLQTVNFTTGTPDPAVPAVSDMPITVQSSGILPNGQYIFGDGTSAVTSMLLYPFASGYSLWAGDMPESDPSYVPNGATTPLYSPPPNTVVTLPITSATTAAVTLPVYPLTISTLAGSVLTATEVDGSGYTYDLTPPSPAGTSATGLGLGQYQVTSSLAGVASNIFVWITPSGVYYSATEMNAPSQGTLATGAVTLL
jgi:Tfp pilus assembly protein PilV